MLHVAAEVAPWSQSGGLADVVGALPRALGREGVRCAVISPLYRAVRVTAATRGVDLADTGVALRIDVGGGLEVRIVSAGEQGGFTNYFVACDPLYDRDALYGDSRGAYVDNAIRYAALCRAAVDAAPALCGGAPELLHAHDWHAALALIYARTGPRPALPQTATALTIHNLAHQGVVPASGLGELGIDASLFHADALEYWGQLNLLKGGVLAADAVIAVSPSYAREIQTPEYGCGLDGFMRAHAARVLGIVNGIDTAGWDPRADPALAAPFFCDDLEGKRVCRSALLDELGLGARPTDFVLGVVSRLDPQKGLDLVAEVVPELYGLSARLVLLGAGEPELERRFSWLASVFSRQLAVRIGFDGPLSRRIYAGVDGLLVPSRFEPCGLSQLYAMRYGTIPIVRAVGGLGDTVRDPGDAELARGAGTGFCFAEATPDGLRHAIARAARLRRDDPGGWRAVIRAAMARDSSWGPSARRYREIYRQLCDGARPLSPLAPARASLPP